MNPAERLYFEDLFGIAAEQQADKEEKTSRLAARKARKAEKGAAATAEEVKQTDAAKAGLEKILQRQADRTDLKRLEDMADAEKKEVKDMMAALGGAPADFNRAMDTNP